MMTYIACALSHFCHKVTICIELLESLSFSIASCQSYRPPTTESCCFAKWRHLWQSWRTISAIATFSIYGLMVSARSRRTVRLIKAIKSCHTWAVPSFHLSCCFDSVVWFIGSNVGFHTEFQGEYEYFIQKDISDYIIQTKTKDRFQISMSYCRSTAVFHWELRQRSISCTDFLFQSA